MLSHFETAAGALHITATPELADHHWQHRARLLQLTGAERLVLTVQLPGRDTLLLCWAPPPLPPSLASTRRSLTPCTAL
jgi:hypothetical protein